ncbi:MAG: hypothetical protein QXM16_03830 [Nitrososphaerota archaeon]
MSLNHGEFFIPAKPQHQTFDKPIPREIHASIALNHLDRLERGEDAVTIYTSRVDRKMVSESLTYLGIPHIATRDGFIAPGQLILRMGLPIVEEQDSM